MNTWMGKKLMLRHAVHSPKSARIPKAIREQTWLRYNGETYKAKCNVVWCQNITTPFTFDVGHNIPQSKGGGTEIDNLRPICPSCNKSMGNKYTIDEFSKLSSPVQPIPVPVPVAVQKKVFWWKKICCYNIA